jgi:hypothetical protein
LSSPQPPRTPPRFTNTQDDTRIHHLDGCIDCLVDPRVLDATTTPPLGLSEIISEDDYQNFIRSTNGMIRIYDHILARRSLINIYPCLLYLFVYHGLILPNYHPEQRSIFFALVPLITFIVSCLLFSKVFMKKIIQEIDKELHDAYHNAQTTCVDLSQRPTSSLPSSSPEIHVKCTLQSKSCWDFVGSYIDMDYIEFTIESTSNKTENSALNASEDYQVMV